MMVRIAFCLAALLAGRVAAAGEVVCFTPGAGKTCSQSVLQHVEFKSVVTEFIDPRGTTIGHSVSRLLWREVLDSISDLKGAGAILAYDARGQLRTILKGRDYKDVLQSDYHNAATKVARELDARMTLWGAVLEHEGSVSVEPYLTLLPRVDDPWTKLHLRFESAGLPALSAQIAQRRFNFAPLRTDRARLFRRDWLTRCRLKAGCPKGIDVRKGPGNSFPIIDHAPVGAIVVGRDMHEQWVEIDRPGGGSGYVNVYHVEVVAPAVHVLAKSVRLRAEPASQARPLEVSAAAGSTYETRGVRRAGDQRLWYLVEVSGARGWLPPETVQRDYRFPVVHFVAGVYRYARRDYRRAIQEFERFIERSREAEDNVTLAAAYQYLAASKVAAAGTAGVVAAQHALGDVQKALEQTPYDPNAYVLSSVIRLGSSLDAEGPFEAVRDLGRGLALDSENATARMLLRRLSSIAESHRTRLLARDTDPLRLEAEIGALRERMNRVNNKRVDRP